MPPRIYRRRICRQKALPARERARRRRNPRCGVVPGFEALPPALLPVAGSTDSRSRRHRGVSGQRPLDAHRDDPEFGYRYLADEAEASGQPMAVRTAWRLCSTNAWFSAFGKGRAKNGKKPGPPVHDDLCAVVDADGKTRHEFRADAPNQLWLTDISEHHTDEGKLYLCAVKDAYSARIVGYSISSRMKARLAVDALEMAVTRRGDVAGCVTHSDRGSQFRSKKFTRTLDRHGIIGSMGRVGAAGDNAAMESFFALLQKNVLDRRRWATRDQLRIAIVTWIERTYHRRRRQARLGRLTPVEYEAIIEPAALAA